MDLDADLVAARPLPRWQQVSERLIRDVASGRLADGARLPPEREMAAALGLAVGTLRKALADLAAKGLIDRRQGSGNYIRHRAGVTSVYSMFRLELAGGGGLPTAEVIGVARRPKPAGAPAFGPSAEAHRIRRLRRLDGVAVALEEIWLDLAAAMLPPDGPSDGPSGGLSEALYHHLRTELGLDISRAEDRVGVARVPGWTRPIMPQPTRP